MTTHNIPISIKKTKVTKLQPEDSSKGHKNEFEIAVIKEPSVFVALKVYCTQIF